MLVARAAEGDSPIGYASTRVVALLERARRSADPEALDGAYGELMPMLQTDLPLTYLAPGVAMTAAHRRVRGLTSPYRAYLFAHAEGLWIDEEHE